MLDALGLAVVSLATWRISVALVREAGPWDLLLRLREAFGIEHGEDGEPIVIPDRMPATLFACVWCLSAWVVWPLLALWFLVPLLVTGFAIAAGAVIIESGVRRLNRD